MRTRWLFVAVLTLAAAFPSSVQAGDGWRVVDTAGVVRVGGPGFMPVALTRDQELSSDAWIETAAGRAVLVRGHETVIVEPNSRVQLPGALVNGNTQVLQSVGSAIYKIGKQKDPHFQVDTPYMAAVVKGTSFSVTVSDDKASVTVTEGLVEVSTPDQQDVEFVRPGFTALVSRDNSSDIVIDHTRASDLPFSAPVPRNEGESTQAVMILKAIGDVEVDVKEVSGGLVTSAETLVDPVPAKGDSEQTNGAKDDVDMKPKEDVILRDESTGPTDFGPPLGDAPTDSGIGTTPGTIAAVADLPTDEVMDDLRGGGNGNAFGVGNGKALGHLKGGGPN